MPQHIHATGQGKRRLPDTQEPDARPTRACPFPKWGTHHLKFDTVSNLETIGSTRSPSPAATGNVVLFANSSKNGPELPNVLAMPARS
jgi:hypothetical protein